MLIVICIIIYIIYRKNDSIRDITLSESVIKEPTEDITSMEVRGSWPLLVFAQSHGKMKYGKCKNHSTGETFIACAFIQNNNTIYVYFSKSLGILTIKEIQERKHDLKVIRSSAGKYYLFQKDYPEYEKVDI